MGDYNYTCDQCPRTFKLEEFYEKHKKVHQLKKQHRCEVCGFVYGAAKGLEGHLKTHTEKDLMATAKALQSNTPEPPYNMDFHFLNPRGVLAQAAPITAAVVAAAAPLPPQPPAARREKSASLASSEMAEEAVTPGAKGPSSAGTGTYEVYDSVPDLSDTAAVQNESGFFTCSICRREFSGLNSLRKHAPIHTRRVQHACDVCGFVFGKKEYLLDHARKHTGEVSPMCDLCGQTFNKSLKLKEHRRLHKNFRPDGVTVHESLPFRCHVCREVFQQARTLAAHLSTCHPESGGYKCDHCDATFGDVRGKNHHMYNEHATNAFQSKCVSCPKCGQGFTRHYNLKVHIVKTHGQEYVDNNFTPEEFAALTRSPPPPNLLKKPATTVLKSNVANGNKPGPLSSKILKGLNHCSVLESMEPRPNQKNHAYDEDNNDPPTIAIKPPKRRRPGPASRTNAPPEIRAVSNVPSYLDASQYDGCREGGYECTECGKVLQHKQTYVSHMRVIHGNYYGGNRWKGHSSVVDMILEESAKLSPKKRAGAGGPSRIGGVDASNVTMCSVCEQVFPNPSSLRNHVVNVHIQGQTHTCDLCGKAFLSAENLEAHNKDKHPNLNKRLQSLRDALGLEDEDDDEAAKRRAAAKRARLNPDLLVPQGISVSGEGEGQPKSLPEPSLLPSTSVLSTVVVVSSSSSSSTSSSTSLSPTTSTVTTTSNSLASSVVDLSTTSTSSKDFPLINNNNEGEGPLALLQQQGSGGSTGRKKNSICKVCGVVLSPKTNVNVHMRTHSGARPYACVLCGNRFRQKAHLMKHFRCSHNQKRPPYVCLFCPDECASSNDLYRHITDKHGRETDELAKANGFSKGEEEEIRIDGAAETSEAPHLQQQEQHPQQQTPLQISPGISLPLHPVVPEQIDDDHGQEEEEEKLSIQEEEDNVRYEPITEAFVFEEQIIHPCYVVLPFVKDHEVETMCGRPITAYYDSEENAAEDEEDEGKLTIDETREEEEVSPPPEAVPAEERPLLQSALRSVSQETGLSGEEIMHRNNNSCYDAEDIKPPAVDGDKAAGFYPNSLIGDFSLPFSLSSIWKKKVDVLPPEIRHQLEMIQKHEEIKQLNSGHLNNQATPTNNSSRPKPKPKSRSTAKNSGSTSPKGSASPSSSDGSEPRRSSGAGASSTQVSDYEAQIQNDFWPLDCIKCSVLVSSLENFNLHMNDHWSDDKCCPVCGLLINSKRFNFKQHLKIHTGEKPFTCNICSRSFRQKAHMVKHITTHRNGASSNAAAAEVAVK